MSSKKLSDYLYDLPEERIAHFPLAQRDSSKLLHYNGSISHHTYTNIGELLPKNTTFVLNDTRVIPARLHFYKETGAFIEIFLLAPISPIDMNAAMGASGKVTWKCAIGNLKKWKTGALHMELPSTIFSAELTSREQSEVTFTWTGELVFSEIIEQMGKIPLPPYIKREAINEDKERYQTVFSAVPGAVAAPTAGLHFTPTLINKLKQDGKKFEHVTLHVGAGTFQPIKTEEISEHIMHGEVFSIKKEVLKNLSTSSYICAVGTTSLRTLESLYWYGVLLIEKGEYTPFSIDKEAAYRQYSFELPNYQTAFNAVLEKGLFDELGEIHGETSIFIFPGYSFRVVKALATNFHQPGSTLILLVAAFIGNHWKEIYKEALASGYRFLSYGDSSLLVPS